MSKDLTKIFKHVTDAVVSVEDTSANPVTTAINQFPLVHLGLLEDGGSKGTTNKNELREAGGSMIQLSSDVELKMSGIELDPVEVTNVETYEKAENNSLFLFGPQQSHKVANLGLTVEIQAELSAKGKKSVGVSMKKFKQSLSDFDLGRAATYFSTNKAYQYLQIIKNIRRENLVFEAYPYLGNFGATTKLFDASKNRYGATLAGGAAWAAAPDANYSMLTFDGVNDSADFGDILDDDGTSDWLIECWIKILAANASYARIAGKGRTATGTQQGFSFYRSFDNIIYFELGDGTHNGSISGASVLQNVWTHVPIFLDRSTFPTVTSFANAASLLLGADASNFGNIVLGALRIYKFTPSESPADPSVIYNRHKAAEQSIFGL